MIPERPTRPRASADPTDPTRVPRFVDRLTGATHDSGRALVSAYLARLAERAGTTIAPLDDGDYAELRKGSIAMGINVLEAHGVLVILAPVMRVPATGREPFYRRLLELSFLTTSDAAFAIDEAKDEVVVRALRGLAGLDYEEFEDLVETVGKVADTWDDALKREFGVR